MKLIAPLLLLLFLCACNSGLRKKEDHHIIQVNRAYKLPIIDGKANENSWNMAAWHPLDQNWLGNRYAHEDFNGRFKLNWDESKLYLLVEIEDDSLFD